MAAPVPAVRMSGVTKWFDRTRALDGVDFELAPGEIHALLGENGAGKSTLMHVLSGRFPPDSGSIEIDGRPVTLRNARDAAREGIGIVHQHFALVANLTVAENLALALPEQTPWILPRRGMARRALETAEALGWKLEPDRPVWQLPVGQQQRLEIVKVLAQEPRILIFDEPTAVLAPVELEELFTVLSRLREEGKALVFITHKLREVMALCDRVTVLRRGRNAGRVRVAETDPTDLARRMVGAQSEAELAELTLEGELPHPPSSPGAASAEGTAPVLRVRDLWVRDDRGLPAVRGIGFEVRAGEVLGIAGVDGNGQMELADALLGMRRPERGEVGLALAGGGEVRPGERAYRAEIGYIPQDRHRSGIVAGMSLRDNLILELHQRSEATWGPWLRWPFLNARAAEMASLYDVRAAGLAQSAGTLSGGNQQKIVVARAMDKNPRLLVAVNPTRGVDVGSTAFIHDRIRRQRAAGAAVLLISTELDEVTALSDRVGVLYEGALMGIVSPATSREELGMMMGGRRKSEPAAP